MDYYKRLGVSKNVSPDELKRAYKKLAMQHHPDRGGNQQLFQEINEAYDTLKDPQKRQDYDNPQQRADFNMNAQNMNDIFGQFFRNNMYRTSRNKDLMLTVKITLQDVMTGKDVVGRYRLNSGREEVANIRVPFGVESGQTMRYKGLGDDSIKQIPRGDLLVKIIVVADKRFRRDRSHLYTNCSINVFELVLGTTLLVDKIEGGPLEVKIPAGTNPGTILSIPGYGLPDRNKKKRGNLYLEIKGITPKIDDKDILKKVKDLNNGINISTR